MARMQKTVLITAKIPCRLGTVTLEIAKMVTPVETKYSFLELNSWSRNNNSNNSQRWANALHSLNAAIEEFKAVSQEWLRSTSEDNNRK